METERNVFGEDYSAINELLRTNYLALRKVDPHHELLKYLTEVTETSLGYNPNPRIREELINRFPCPDMFLNHLPPKGTLTRYALALRGAADEKMLVENKP